MPPTQRIPKYVRLAHTLREQMNSGALKPGDQLVSYVQAQTQYGIGQSTLDRVYRLLEEDGLIVRSAKQGVFVAEAKRRDRTHVVGIMGHESGFGGNPYWAKFWEGIQQVAHDEKVELLVLHKDSVVKWEKMDGLVQWLPVLKTPACMPTVALMNRDHRAASVGTDDYQATKDAVAYLVELGHRRIAFLTLGVSLAHDDIAQGRLEGYLDALREAGIAPDRNWTRPLREPWGDAGKFLDMGYNQMKKWIEDDWGSCECTALLAQNDETAIGAIRALFEAGIDVPRDVSVVGFDGIDIADYMRPKLTTLVVPLLEIGAAAMRLLISKIEGAAPEDLAAESKEPELMLRSVLRIGESTAPPQPA